MTKVVGYSSEEDFRRAAAVTRYVERGGIDHPYYRRQPPADFFEILLGKPDADITKGNNGTVSRYDPSDGSDTGENDTVYFRVGDGASGKWVYYVNLGGFYEAIGGECP